MDLAGTHSALQARWAHGGVTTQNELTNTYLKGLTEYLQNQTNKIRDWVEDRQSRIAWQTINEVYSTVSNSGGTASFGF